LSYRATKIYLKLGGGGGHSVTNLGFFDIYLFLGAPDPIMDAAILIASASTMPAQNCVDCRQQISVVLPIPSEFFKFLADIVGGEPDSRLTINEMSHRSADASSLKPVSFRRQQSLVGL
jgi:hypothetical protein